MASYWMAYRNYSPVRELVHVILKGKRLSGKGISNEYEFIKETVLSAFDEEKHLREALSQQTPVIRANFLSRLIRGHLDPASVTESSLEFMGIRFASNRFRVLLIDIDDCSRFSRGDTEKEWALIRFVIGNIACELLDRRGYIVEMDQTRLAILMNVDADPATENEIVDRFVVELRNIVESRFRTFITIAVSGVREGMEGLAQCYREVLEALDYKFIKGQNSILYYSDIQFQDSHYYFYPVDSEVQLMNCTKSGEYEQVERLLESIYETNFKTDRLTPELGKCLFYEIVGTLLKTLHSLNIEYEAVFRDGSNPIHQLADCVTVEEMQLKTKKWYKAVCEHIVLGRSDHRERLLAAIIRHIDQSYHDGMLSLVSIADHFGITPQYLSTFSKKQSGQNISDYIAKVRITHAKRLMNDKTLSLSQIAEMVGYANYIGFIRVFKKVEGITPENTGIRWNDIMEAAMNRFNLDS